MYRLTVKFGASNTPQLLETGTHEECLKGIDKYLEFIQTEHRTHRTGYVFEKKINPLNADCFFIASMKMNGRFPRAGLWATFQIDSPTEHSEYDDIKSHAILPSEVGGVILTLQGV